MSYFRKKQNEDKVFRGSYVYTRNDNVYCEENFDLYKDKKDYSLTFQSQIISRVSTGELLNVSIDYTVNKDYIPQKVIIDRSLGEDHVQELFIFDSRSTRINYSLITKTGEEKVTLNTAPKFHIATPSISCSMLFLRSKKFDNTGKNFYSILGSKNFWKFDEEPSFKNIMLQRTNTTTETINIDGKSVTATQYKLEEQSDNLLDVAPSVRIWLSQHYTIPYLIKTPDGTKIQIKYLNNLDKET
ncbi:hypothetical protein HBN50_10620 [Halobacteriovorax sp. GB3]|uniref:hypothetical protein n=1 Tax=Halobacteriovorax sp. GB3 TaxID=2719615 RepID=UPI0023611582|nr:hypothetical protein [Halobacteriovorax sp. GB3]MDD0853555.1 hypothetical protein [Halobacteriovorax sp. GB3]